MSFNKVFLIIVGLTFSLLSLADADASALSRKPPSHANVTLSHAWVRATADGQQVGAAYTNLMSDQSATLISAETDIAGSVEIHSMSMDNGVMKMRRLNTLSLPKGETVSLAPGGFHFMLFDLKKPLKAGENTTFKLTFKAEDGKIFIQKLIMPILTEAPAKNEKAY